eukprot:2083500-Pyramimonas_sp.AAC.1
MYLSAYLVSSSAEALASKKSSAISSRSPSEISSRPLVCTSANTHKPVKTEDRPKTTSNESFARKQTEGGRGRAAATAPTRRRPPESGAAGTVGEITAGAGEITVGAGKITAGAGEITVGAGEITAGAGEITVVGR